MNTPIKIAFAETDLAQVSTLPGKIAVLVGEDGKLDAAGRRLNTLVRKTIVRFLEGDGFSGMGIGDAVALDYPAAIAAVSVIIVKLPAKATTEQARKAGAALARQLDGAGMTVMAGNHRSAAELAYGLTLRAYDYHDHKTDPRKALGPVTVMATSAAKLAEKFAPMAAIAEGVFFTRDLTNAPANVLTTTTFADQLLDLAKLGVKVEVLEEKDLEKLGMGALLCVGQGSASPSKVVVMQWQGGGAEAPFALVGKGVVFDTGGISLKPAAGMEDMTMDMGGAGVVAGVMRSLALRGAKANVVGLVGLVENMPSGTATRPGDVVTSMKGTTIEVINTDAEGRLVLADVLWYAQERFKPVAMINLATLTGAIIIGLGHENAGVFSNDDAFAAKFLRAAKAEGEGAWQMPMGPAYDKLIKSQFADIKNTGGRPAGSITAAQFLRRFVRDDVPWCHLDIAGVASVKSDTMLAPKGATGWGVMALNRLIADTYEAK